MKGWRDGGNPAKSPDNFAKVQKPRAAGSPATGMVEGHRTWNPLLAWFPLLKRGAGDDAADLLSTFVLLMPHTWFPLL